MGKILEVKNLTFLYGETEAFSDLNFSVEKGDFIGLTGPNGAGKTTLVRSILGLEEKYTGTIELFGKDRRNFSDWNKIGYLPQRVNAFNPLFPATVMEVVGLGLLSKKTFPKKFTRADKEKIMSKLELMDITDLKDKMVGELSGGQQQRVFLARALVANPELLILDEPSTSLDPHSRASFYKLIKDLNREKGITVILITHDTSETGGFANKMLFLDKKIVFYGEFTDFCRSGEMTDFFGHSLQHVICHQHREDKAHH